MTTGETIGAIGTILEGVYYTLKQATEILGVDAKTLQKRMQRAHVEPISSPDDRRLKLLSEGQVQTLQSSLERTAKVPRSDTPLGETMKVLKLLTRRVTKLEEQLAKQEEEQSNLQRELTWRMEEWERTSAALLAVLGIFQNELAARGMPIATDGGKNTDAPSPVDAAKVQETADRLLQAVGATSS